MGTQMVRFKIMPVSKSYMVEVEHCDNVQRRADGVTMPSTTSRRVSTISLIEELARLGGLLSDC